jgi:hypothetical protein
MAQTLRASKDGTLEYLLPQSLLADVRQILAKGYPEHFFQEAQRGRD